MIAVSYHLAKLYIWAAQLKMQFIFHAIIDLQWWCVNVYVKNQDVWLSDSNGVTAGTQVWYEKNLIMLILVSMIVCKFKDDIG